jgi:hypothetical protein
MMFRFPAFQGFTMARLLVVALSFPTLAVLPPGYKGVPFHDSTQQIPGRIRFFNFDQGIPGTTGGGAVLDVNTKEVTWHDYMGTGGWYCHDQRPTTGTSLQRMGAGGDRMSNDWKGANYIGDSAKNDCYVADANQGDWTKYTVHVKQRGVYSLSILEAAQGIEKQWGPYIELVLLNGTDSISTGTDTLHLTDYFHAWYYMKDFRRLTLDSGIQVLKYQVCNDPAGNGPMNVDWVDFTYVGPVQAAYPNKHFTAANELSIRKITPQANGGAQLEFQSAGSMPVKLERFDARGALLSTKTLASVHTGTNRVQLGENGGRSGVVLIRLSQGNMRSEGKANLLR